MVPGKREFQISSSSSKTDCGFAFAHSKAPTSSSRLNHGNLPNPQSRSSVAARSSLDSSKNSLTSPWQSSPSHRRTRLRFGIPCFAGKYRECLPLEADAGDADLPFSNKFKAFLPNSLTIETGNFAD